VAKRYQPQTLLGEQGGVQTFAGRDALNGLPVRLYTFMGEPTAKVGELESPYIPPVLSSSFVGGAGEVIAAFSPEFQKLRGTVAPRQVEALLKQTAAALDDAARAGVVHGDLSPERVLFDREAGEGGRFLLEGYGVPWRVRPSEFSAPERIGGASFASDLFSWARTVTHLSGPLPGDLRDLLARCLDADPKARPRAREVRAALESYPFGARSPQPNRSHQSARDESAFDRFAVDQDEADDQDDFLTMPAQPERLQPDKSPDRTRPIIVRLESEQPDTADVQTPRTETAQAEPAQTETPPTETPQRAIQPQPTSLPEPQQPRPRSTSQPLSRPAVIKSPPQPTTASRTARVLPQEPGAKLPPDSLRQIDATSAYAARRARYDAMHDLGTPKSDIPEPDTPEPEAKAPATVSDVLPRPSVRVRPALDDADDFEVIDDIDDRAPDPTLNRGGRRVLLLTLLGIAILVLLALQFI
jgi:serine/threonine protein kinase